MMPARSRLISRSVAASCTMALLLAAWGVSHAAKPERKPARKSNNPAATASTAPWRGPDPARIDALLDDYAQQHQLTPAPLCDDATFLRRATVDLLYRIPTLDEVDRYFADPPEKRRQNLLARLVNHPRFADRWTHYWADVLRLRGRQTGGQATIQYVRRAMAENRPFDELVVSLLSAKGDIRENPAVGFVAQHRGDAFELTGSVVQGFMGVRFKCAHCHDHPYDAWTQEQYYQLASFFGHTGFLGNDARTVVVENPAGSVEWPPNDKPGPYKPVKPQWPVAPASMDQAMKAAVQQLATIREERNAQRQLKSLLDAPTDEEQSELARALAGTTAEVAISDISPTRQNAAKHLVDPSNRLFARCIVNRVWAEMMGKGIVDPVDDFRRDNPPSHPELLDELANAFIASGHDFRGLVAGIALSKAYQRAPMTGLSEIAREPAEDGFLAARTRRMHAEAIYDSLITAGWLQQPKYAAGTRMRERTVRQRVAIRIDPQNDQSPPAPGPAAETPVRQVAAPMRADQANDLAALLAGDPLAGLMDDDFNTLQMLQAARDAEMALSSDQPRPRFRYETREVRERYEDNPSYRFALSQTDPAPPEHFLRQFGQSPRVQLGDERLRNASTRQALILMNGDLANQAAEIGDIEPAARLIQQNADTRELVKLCYRQILTREPDADELALAIRMIENAGPDRRNALADLRWALLNCNEFRFVP